MPRMAGGGNEGAQGDAGDVRGKWEGAQQDGNGQGGVVQLVTDGWG